MKIAILGCHGFLGSHILRRLIMQGMTVVGIDRYESIPDFRRTIIPAGWKPVVGDLLDERILYETLSDVNVIVYAAGNPSPGSNSFDLLFAEELRIVIKLLEFMKRHNSESKLIFISSGGTVYGSTDCGVLSQEDDPLNPISLYGIMKLSCEKAIGAFHHQNGLDATILRVSNPYGIGQPLDGQQGLIPVVLGKLLRQETVHVWGTGHSYRDYLYVEDLAQLVCCTITTKNTHGVFNAGTGKPTSILEILSLASQISGLDPRVQFHAARPQDVQWNVLSIEKARQLLGWSPSVLLAAGMAKVYSWMKEYLCELSDKE